MQDWAARPLDGVYVAVFIDAIMVKVRDGQVANRPVYAAIGVTVDGRKDVLGLWMGVGGEGAKFWMSVLTDLRNRGVRDVFFLVCDGLKGLPDVVEHVWPQTVVQTCIIHLIRNTFRLASRADHDAIKTRSASAIYTAPNADAAEFALEELEEKWGKKYRAIIRLWRNAWNEFIPFLDYDVEIRRVICSTNAIESLNARYRRAVRARGHFPTEQAALKCLYLVTRSLDPTGTGRTRWTMRWKPVIDAFAITFSDRWPGASRRSRHRVSRGDRPVGGDAEADREAVGGQQQAEPFVAASVLVGEQMSLWVPRTVSQSLISAVTVGRPQQHRPSQHSMIARCSLRIRLPDAHPHAGLGHVARAGSRTRHSR